MEALETSTGERNNELSYVESSKSRKETLLVQAIDKEKCFPTEAAEIWREKYQESKTLIDHYRAQVDFLTQQLSISVELSPTRASLTEDSRSDRHGNVLQLLRSNVTTAKQEEEIVRLSSIVCDLRIEVFKSKKLEEELRLRLSKITEAVQHRDDVIKTLEQKTEVSFERETKSEMQQHDTGGEVLKWKLEASEFKDQLVVKDEEIARKTALLADAEEKIQSLIKEKKVGFEQRRPVQEILLNSKARLKLAKEAKEKVGNELEIQRERTKELEVAIKTLKQKVRASNEEKQNDKLKNSQNLQSMMEEVATLQSMVASLRRDRPVVDPVDQEKRDLERFNQTIQRDLESQIKINFQLEENLKYQLEITKQQEAKLKQQSFISVDEQARVSDLAAQNQTLSQQNKALKIRIEKSKVAEETIREDLKSILNVAEEKQVLIQKLKKAKDSAEVQVKDLNQQLISLKKEYNTMSGKGLKGTSGIAMPTPELIVLKESSGNFRQNKMSATKESTKVSTKSLKVGVKNDLQVDKISRGIIERLEKEKSALARDVEKLHKVLKFHKNSDKEAHEKMIEESKLTRLENTEKVKTITTLQEKLNKELEKKQNFKFEFEELKRKLIELEAEKANLKATMEADKAEAEERLNSKLVAVSEEVATLHKVLNVERISNRQAVKSYKELEQKVNVNKLDNENKEKELATLQAKLKKEIGDKHSHKFEFEELKRKLIELEAEKANLKATMEADKAEAEERTNVETFVLNKEVEKLQKVLNIQRVSNDDVMKSYKEIEAKADVTILDNVKKEKELATLQAKLKEEFVKKKSSKFELEELKRKLVELEAEKANLKATMEADKDEAEESWDVREAALKKEVENLRHLLSIQQKSNRNVDKAFDKLQEEAKILKLNAIWKEKEFTTMEGKLDKKAVENKNLKFELKELKRKLMELEAEKANLQATIKVEKAEAEERTKIETVQLKTEVEKLQEVLNVQSASTDDFMESYEEIQTAFDITKLDNAKKEEALVTLQAKLKKEFEEKQNFQFELEKLKRKLVELEAEKAYLKASMKADKAEAEERLDNVKKDKELASQAKLKKEIADKQSYKFELEELKRKLVELEAEKANLKATMEADKAEAEERVFNERRKVQDFKEKYSSLESRCEECSNLESIIADKNSEIVALQAMVDCLQGKLEKTNSLVHAAIEEETRHEWDDNDFDKRKTADDEPSPDTFQESTKLGNLQEILRNCEEELESERRKHKVQADNFKRMQILKDDLLKEKEKKLMEAEDRIEELNRRVTSPQNNGSSVSTEHLQSQAVISNNTTLVCMEDSAYFMDEITSYKEEIKELENQIRDLSMHNTWRQSRDFFVTRITNIKLEFENKRWKNQVERLTKQFKKSSTSMDNSGKDCQLCEERLKEIADLDMKVERLQTELSHFNEYFFDEVDDLKYNYAEAVKLNVIYEEQLKDISRRHGISINIRIEEFDGKEEGGGTTNDDAKSKVKSHDLEVGKEQNVKEDKSPQ